MPQTKSKCVVCNNNAQVDNTNIHELKIVCPFCGKFKITDVALAVIPKDRYPDWRTKLQDWLKRNQTDGYVLISTSIVETIF